MARIYAGILGPLAFLTSLARGMLHGAGPESVLATACCCLWLFAAVGCVMGWIGQHAVEDAMSARVAAQLAEGGGAATDVREGSQATGA